MQFIRNSLACHAILNCKNPVENCVSHHTLKTGDELKFHSFALRKQLIPGK